MTEPTPAERFTAAMGAERSERAPPPQTAAPSGARAGADQGEYVTGWGVTNSPAEALAALQADESFVAALYDENHVAHGAAVARKAALYRAIHGDEPATIESASSEPIIVQAEDGSYVLSPEPTAAEMDAVAVRAASLAIASQGVEPELADVLAQWSTEVGLNAVETADLANGIVSSNHRSPEAAIASLGSEGGRTVARAQAAAYKLGIPADLLNMEVSEHLVLGEHPAFIKTMAALGERMGL
jgi:hypothetical protein